MSFYFIKHYIKCSRGGKLGKFRAQRKTNQVSFPFPSAKGCDCVLFKSVLRPDAESAGAAIRSDFYVRKCSSDEFVRESLEALKQTKERTHLQSLKSWRKFQRKTWEAIRYKLFVVQSLLRHPSSELSFLSLYRTRKMKLNVVGLHQNDDTNWFRRTPRGEKCNHYNDFFEMNTGFVLNVINFKTMAGGVVSHSGSFSLLLRSV